MLELHQSTAFSELFEFIEILGNTWQYLEFFEMLGNIWKYPKMPRNSPANGNYKATFIHLISLWSSSIINEG